MSTSPKHASYIPRSHLPPLCYSLHKYTLPPAKSASPQIIVFKMLSHIPLNFLGLSSKCKDKSASLAQSVFFLLYDGPMADVVRLKSGFKWPRRSVWTTCPVILAGNLALPLHLSLYSLAISSSLTSSSCSPNNPYLTTAKEHRDERNTNLGKTLGPCCEGTWAWTSDMDYSKESNPKSVTIKKTASTGEVDFAWGSE